MKALFYRLRFFYVPCAIILCIVAITLLMVQKTEGHLAVNSTHTDFQDDFFRWFTYLGDGRFVAVASLILILLVASKKDFFRLLLLAGINLISTGFIVQFLKHVVYSDALRPFGFITSNDLYRVPGIEIHIFNSFPSGHTAAGFAFFSFFAYLFRDKPAIQALSALCAVLVGYSRIYLSQHFLEDTFLGALIGLGCFLISFLLLQKRRNTIGS